MPLSSAQSSDDPEQDDANELGIRVEGLNRDQLQELADKGAALLRHELMIERERRTQRGSA